MEHIIPNSVGGRLTTRGFICAPCNSTAGSTWDAAIAKQQNSLALFFNVARSRGEPPAQNFVTTAGEHLTVHPGHELALARPKYNEIPQPDGTLRIEMTARSKTEARKMLAGVKRKYPTADTEQSLKDARTSRSYPKGAMQFGLSFGGTEAGRSLVKTALAFAHHSGVPVGSCTLALEYLRREEAEPCFGFYYESDLVVGRPRGTPLHCVAVSANPESGVVFGYVEYFGVQRTVVVLCDSYQGPQIDAVHAIDPRSGSEIPVSVSLPFIASDIPSIYQYEKWSDEGIQKAFAEVMPSALERQFELERDRVVKDAVKFAMENCGAKQGDLLTPEHLKKIAELAAQQITPFFMHRRGSI